MVPAAAYIESGLAAAQSIVKEPFFCIELFKIGQPLYPLEKQDFQIKIKPKDNNRYKINLFAKQENQWQQCSQMELSATSAVPKSVDINSLKSSFNHSVDIAQFYSDHRQGPLFYGDKLQTLREGYVASNQVLSQVVLTKTNNESGYCFHPMVIENAIQSLFLMNKKY